MNKKYFVFISCLLVVNLLISCSATNTLTISVTEPAPVFLNKKITKIGIINRSIPDKKHEVLDAIDKILTAEGAALDKLGSRAALEGLKEELLKNNQFVSVVLVDDLDSKKYATDQFSAPIPWQKVSEICTKNNVEALFELSFFDTDSKIGYKTANAEVKNGFGLKIPMIAHEVTVNTLIKTGWRIYDNTDKVISDVYRDAKSIALVGRGINPIKAFETITTRKDAVLSVSTRMGQNYAYSILPNRIRVSRDYYVKGNNNFEIGKRRAQAGQWDSAAELWLMETKNRNSKIAGRACYNMGIINEINGNMDTAIDWATKSYTDYNDSNALNYINILKSRKAKNEQLEREMN